MRQQQSIYGCTSTATPTTSTNMRVTRPPAPPSTPRASNHTVNAHALSIRAATLLHCLMRHASSLPRSRIGVGPLFPQRQPDARVHQRAIPVLGCRVRRRDWPPGPVCAGEPLSVHYYHPSMSHSILFHPPLPLRSSRLTYALNSPLLSRQSYILSIVLPIAAMLLLCSYPPLHVMLSFLLAPALLPPPSPAHVLTPSPNSLPITSVPFLPSNSAANSASATGSRSNSNL
ncbi:hypothetical protein C8J57DRAFT_1719054 [Mycena rebaudengoi]|nr:hypothetical protein C8J57DRAFT_1719054 [Mycena rebaudengoi]